MTQRPGKTAKRVVVGGYRLLYPLVKRLGLAGRAKALYELTYWRARKSKEGTLANSWYEDVYTHHIGVERSFYQGKKILDIGCGPRGSLEWADDAAERVGLDPLVNSYRALGIDQHRMQYVNAPSEKIPFPDNYFDVVLSLNSLDHVDDVAQTAREIIRVTKPGGHFFVVVEVNHKPTIAEPQMLDWTLSTYFQPQMRVLEEHHFEENPKGAGSTVSLRSKIPFDHQNSTPRSGVFLAKLIKV
ncbi:MAG: class I SAM-dependent methyltransferase [bacterium]|nr:class I SAM-dependent methyltransferase [bacterium]